MGITYEDLTPSHAQTIEIRKLSKSKKLDFNSLEDILCQKKEIKMIKYHLIKIK